MPKPDPATDYYRRVSCSDQLAGTVIEMLRTGTPARCKLPPGHVGDHEGVVVLYWANTEASDAEV